MKHLVRRMIAVVCVLVAALALALPGGTVPTSAQAEASAGDWSIGYHGYMGPGFSTLPVVVFSVTSHVDKGVTKVYVKNNSDIPVTAVRFKWLLSTDRDRRTILRQGETVLVKLPEALSPGGRTRVDYPVVMFENVNEPLLKRGKLAGDYRIEVAVSEIKFARGSGWKWGEPFTGKIAFAKPYNAGGCANQTCKKNGDTYQCVDGTGELCTNQGTECNSSICGLLD